MPETNIAEVHVVPYREVWAVEALGIKYLEFATQELALNFGRLQAEKKQAPLFVHDRNGDIVQVIHLAKPKESQPQVEAPRQKKGVQAA